MEGGGGINLDSLLSLTPFSSFFCLFGDCSITSQMAVISSFVSESVACNHDGAETSFQPVHPLETLIWTQLFVRWVWVQTSHALEFYNVFNQITDFWLVFLNLANQASEVHLVKRDCGLFVQSYISEIYIGSLALAPWIAYLNFNM